MKTDSSKKTEDKSVSLSDFPFQQIRFTCKHAGKPRVRGEGKRSMQAYMPRECPMFLRLKFDHKEMQYRITKLEATHNHTTSVGEFKHYSTARRMGGSEKDDIKALVDLNVETKTSRLLLENKLGKQFKQRTSTILKVTLTVKERVGFRGVNYWVKH